MKLKQILTEDSSDYYDALEYENLNDEPRNQTNEELINKVSNLYKINPSCLIGLDRNILSELMNMKINYSSINFNDAKSALKLDINDVIIATCF